MSEPRLMNVEAVAERLNVSPAWVYARVSDGSMPHYKLKGAVRFSEAQLDAFLASKEQSPAKVRVAVKPLKNLTLNT